ncbi:MAG: hypothetical protein CMM47_08875 [Rhodospirillaceae bacterium]|nr:hypothetical protein [Rhodospirillaceae bacterium]
MIIDTHAHILPQDTLEVLRSRGGEFPSVELIVSEEGQFHLTFVEGKMSRPIMSNLRLFEPRQSFMAGAGIDLQLSGGWLDSFGYEIPAEEGADWSRFLNEGMLAECSDKDGILPLATVPLQSGKLAADVLREAVKAGMPGAMIGTQNKGTHGSLDDPDLDPFWEMAAELGVPIIIHPMFGSDDARLHDMQMMNSVGRVTDLSISISRMLFTGHLTRFKGLVVVASTGGGALPYMLGRLERNYNAFSDQMVDPVEQFSQLYFDSLVFQTDVIQFLTTKVGTDRVMLGSDYPFPIGDPDPRRVVETAGYTDDEVDAMLTDNARRLFGI